MANSFLHSLVKFRQVQLCLLLAVAVLFAAPVILQAQSTDPQDVFAALDELEEKGVETWFGRGILDHAWAPVARLQDSLEDKHGLSIFGLYSPILQVGSAVENVNHGFDFFARWDGIVDSPRWGRGSLDIFALHRDDNLIATDSAAFMRELGLVLPINDAEVGGTFNSLSQLAWEQVVAPGRLELVLGQLDPVNLIDKNVFAGYDRQSFIHGALSSNPARSLPSSGLGVGLMLGFFNKAALQGVIMDGDARENSDINGAN